jgi:hypothetical protein
MIKPSRYTFLLGAHHKCDTLPGESVFNVERKQYERDCEMNHVYAPVRDLRNKYSELSDIMRKHRQFILKELQKAEEETNNPGTKWLNHEDVMRRLQSKYGKCHRDKTNPPRTSRY